MKKLVSILLAAVMLLPVMCINASAKTSYNVKASRSYGSGYTYVKLISAADELYYTTDGSTPTDEDKLYTKRLKITKPCTLRVAAYNDGKLVYRVKTSVSVKLKTPKIRQMEDSSTGKQRFKITAASGTIYYTTDGSTPTKTNGKKVPASGIVTVDNCKVIKAVAVKSGWKNSKTASLKPVVTEHSTNKFEQEVVKLVNEFRAENGLPALKTHSTLSKAARQRSQELTEKFGHTRPDGTPCFTIWEEYGLTYHSAAENVAAGQATPADVVNAWIDSEGHRINMLRTDVDYLGVGYIYTDSGYNHYWTQLFWRE